MDPILVLILFILIFAVLPAFLFEYLPKEDFREGLKQKIRKFFNYLFNYRKISPTVKEIPDNPTLSEGIRRLLKDKASRKELFRTLWLEREFDAIEFDNFEEDYYWNIDEEYKKRLKEALLEREEDLRIVLENHWISRHHSSEKIEDIEKLMVIYHHEKDKIGFWAEKIKKMLSEHKGEWMSGQKVIKNDEAITDKEIEVVLEMMCVEEMTDKTKLLVMGILEDSD